jgi:hypothetical protein
MRLALVFHMPGIFDTGGADSLLRFLRGEHEVRAFVCGTMGRTALWDSGLRGVEVRGERPSQLLREVEGEVEAVILALHAFSPPKAHALCWHLLRLSGLSRPLVEVDTGSRQVVPWSEGGRELALSLARGMGFSLSDPPRFGEVLWQEGERRCRKVLGVDPGDYVLVEGRVVGRAEGEEVVLVEEGGRLTEVRGVKLKPGVLERLGRVELEELKVDTTPSLRFTPWTPRRRPQLGRGVVFVDHAGYRVYELVEGAEGAVTVGDDTSTVVGDLLSRTGKPVIALTDGDADGLLRGGSWAKGSLVLRVRDDDEAGKKVLREVFGGERRVEKGMEEVREEILSLLEGEILERRWVRVFGNT